MKLLTRFYLKFFIQSGFPYAAYLKKQNFLRSQGQGCYIAKSANIPDPYLTSIGDNVWITAGCQLLCHDASVIMINIMTKGHLDCVGPITIGDHCFLGNNVIVLSNTTIGSNTIIGAGSVVTQDIPDNVVCAGNPARRITSTEKYVQKMKSASNSYPWQDLLKSNAQHVYDPVLEQRLRMERVEFFFGSR